MKITRISQATGIERTIDFDITEEQWNDYLSGTLIQNAFPTLSPEEREFIITGITADEWDEFMRKPLTEEDAENWHRDVKGEEGYDAT